MTWWRDSVVYEIYVPSFADSDGDGFGDLGGIRSKLDYLRDLGVDAIWLTPFFRSPLADLGYDIANHIEVAPPFGSVAAFDGLLAEAHAAGLRLIVDFVPNHTSDQHAWFVESRSARDHPRRDWYTWRDAKAGDARPNNWLSVFGGPAWTFDPTTCQYYQHSFLPSMPDLDWRNPQVRQAQLDVVRFWLERGVDGLRIDSVDFLMKDSLLRDNPPAAVGSASLHRPLGDYDSQLHLYDKNQPDVHDILRELRSAIDPYGQGEQARLIIGELHIYDWQLWATYFGRNLDELHLPANFGLLTVDWAAAPVRALIQAVEEATPEGAWPNWVLGNHDESRIASRIGLREAQAAMLLLLTLRGTPTIYYGDELGLVDVEIPPGRAADPWAKQSPALSRDPERSPMPWGPGANRGFCPPGCQPWLPVSTQPGVDVESQIGDPSSMLTLTRRLLALRRRSAGLKRGKTTFLEGLPNDVLAFRRRADSDEVVVAVNFCAEKRTVRAEDFARKMVVASTSREPGHLLTASALELNSYEAVVLAPGPI
jgi:alpha-glucosidase